MQTQLLWVICIFTLCCADALACRRLSIVTESHPPVQYELDGQIIGPSTEIVKEVLRLSGMDAEIKIMPWARAYKLAQEPPNTLIYSMVRTESREAMFRWIGPVAQHKGALLALHGRQDLKADSLEEARQHLVGTVRNTYSHDFLVKQGFNEEINLFLVATLDEEIHLLINHRIDFILSDPDTLTFKLRELGLEDTDLNVIAWVPYFNQDLYLAANPRSDKACLSALQQAMDGFRQTAQYQQLYERNSRP